MPPEETEETTEETTTEETTTEETTEQTEAVSPTRKAIMEISQLHPQAAVLQDTAQDDANTKRDKAVARMELREMVRDKLDELKELYPHLTKSQREQYLKNMFTYNVTAQSKIFKSIQKHESDKTEKEKGAQKVTVEQHSTDKTETKTDKNPKFPNTKTGIVNRAVQIAFGKK